MMLLKIAIGILILLVLFVLILIIEAYLASKTPRDKSFKNPSNDPIEFGTGDKTLNYLILGDSTTAGEGGEYTKGIAYQTAQHLAEKTGKKVVMRNYSRTGARTSTVLNKQIPDSEGFIPDVVLLSIGANNVTGGFSFSRTESELKQIIANLQKRNPNVKIIFTATPDIGSVHIIAQPLRYLLGVRARQQNSEVFYPLIESNPNFFLAPIAIRTAKEFKNDRSLLAEDGYHPSQKGYDMWSMLINEALDKAISSGIDPQ